MDIFTFHRKNYLISVDFYSGWFAIDLLNEMLSTAVKAHMARYGVTDVVVSDNGLQFSSKHSRHRGNLNM